MSDLVQFLLARISEDEDTAREAAALAARGETFYTYPGASKDDWRVYYFNWPHERVLAECAAKRVMIQRCLNVIVSFDDHDAEKAHEHGGHFLWLNVTRRERSHAWATLEALAQPYADHPDFDPAWRI